MIMKQNAVDILNIYCCTVQYLDGEGEEPVAKVTMTVPHKGTYKGKTAVPPSWFAMSMALMMFIGAKSLRNTAEGSM
jgi:hypothetical protein